MDGIAVKLGQPFQIKYLLLEIEANDKQNAQNQKLSSIPILMLSFLKASFAPSLEMIYLMLTFSEP